MRDANSWRPTKFVFRDGHLRATRDSTEVGVAARIIADLTADWYGSTLPIHVTGRLLDLGYGNVPFYEAYRQFASSVICVDWEGSVHGNRHIDFHCDLTEPLPLADGSFETIILSDVLEHLPEPEKCWREMHRLLAPHGKIILNIPFAYGLHEAPHDYYRYTQYALQRFARESGFEVIIIVPLGGLVESFVMLLSELFIRARLVSLAKIFQDACMAFSRSVRGRKLAHKTSEWPLSYGMVVEKCGAGAGAERP